ncbi:MAG: hypothetical protein A2W00_09035 [Candidatus Eisenbacteria bacterium RBG_16_71_46]|nr:MAG: hypothetical protein A2W00_09035 [Candidatus Eisenbacteria bacterium RBG_16_71_46]
MSHTIVINRAPVLTLWATVVAERLGFDRDEALSLGKAVAGLNAQAKGRRLGIFTPGKEPGRAARERGRDQALRIELCGRPVPAVNTASGVRAVTGDQAIDPAGVERYLAGKFGADLDAARRAMTALARAFEPEDLAERAFALYAAFRPAIPSGARGWGAKGELDLARLGALAARR